MNKVAHFDCKHDFYNNYKVEDNTVYWLGYAGNGNIKMLNPEWIEKFTITKDGDLLFSRTWQNNTTRTCPNIKFRLSEEIKNNIQEYVKYSGYHPDSLIAFLRSGFDSTENKPKW